MGQDTIPTWDLESHFAGGVLGPSFVAFLAALTADVPAYAAQASGLPALSDDLAAWRRALIELEALAERLHTAMSFAHSHASAHALNQENRMAEATVRDLYSTLERSTVSLQASLDGASAEAFESLIGHPELAEMRPALRLSRSEAYLRMRPALQELYTELSPQALHGWGALYNLISGRLQATVTWPDAPAPVTMGIAEVQGKLSSKHEPTRRAAFVGANAAWKQVEDDCALALDKITGTRLVRNQHLGVDELETTLARNRLQRSTLDAMWAACDPTRPVLQRYLHRKARLLGKGALDWWDLSAPLPDKQGEVTWDWATARIIESFHAFDPSMADFARRAIDARWVEAEPRSGKRQGGYCTRSPRAKESRIFMTWSGTMRSALTLAHELGHAWHNHKLFKLSPSRRDIVSATAETASTFAEALFRDHALCNASDPDTRLAMIDQQLMAGVSFLMNIRARYTFERELYVLRGRGPLDPRVLSQTMERCQRQAYGDGLASWNPTFWSSKLHFYISGFGFYNWPYTFGYLFSSAVYQRASQEGAPFVPRFGDLLQAMGHQRTEDLARDVLGEDLSSAEFWERATAPLTELVQEFLDLTDEPSGQAVTTRPA